MAISDFDNYESQKFERSRKASWKSPYRSWWYDLPNIRADARSGALPITPSRLYKDFGAWLDDTPIVYLRDPRTGERVRHMAPKRGNSAYASRYAKRLSDLDRDMSGLHLSSPFGSRGNRSRTHALLVTFTYDHTRTLQDSWATISSDLADAKIGFRRKLGLSHLASIVVKEGTLSGYPAPHMLLLIDTPVIAIRHRGKSWTKDGVPHPGKTTWRVESMAITEALRSCWHNGYIDIQAIVDNKLDNGTRTVSVASYLFKYLTKSINVSGDVTLDRVDPHDRHAKARAIGIKTFSWQKLFLLRPLHISKQFRTYVAVRVHNPLSQSLHAPKSLWVYDHSDHCKMGDYIKVMTSAMPPDPRPYPLLGANRLATVA